MKVVKTVIFTIWLSITWAGIAAIASLQFLGSVSTIIILAVFVFVASLLSISFVGSEKLETGNINTIFGFELSVIILAASSFLGVISIEEGAISQRHASLEGEAKYYLSEARRDIADALQTICLDGVASGRYCAALVTIESELRKGLEEADIQNIEDAYQLVVDGECCESDEDEPLNSKLVKWHLYQFSEAKHFIEVSKGQLRKPKIGDEMLKSWASPVAFKLFLLFLGATAASLQIGLTSRKYAEKLAVIMALEKQ